MSNKPFLESMTGIENLKLECGWASVQLAAPMP
jgi:hypothetical protein